MLIVSFAFCHVLLLQMKVMYYTLHSSESSNNALFDVKAIRVDLGEEIHLMVQRVFTMHKH